MSVATDSTQPELFSLLSGIVSDAQDLAGHEARLLRQEMLEEVKKAREGAQWLGIASALGVTAVILFGFNLAYLLFSPSTTVVGNPSALPLWICFLICSALMGVASLSAIHLARRKFRRIDLTPHRTLLSLKQGIR